MQQPQGLPTTPTQAVLNTEGSIQEPLGIGETQVVPPPSTPPHPLGSPSATQISSGQVPVFTGDGGGQQLTPREGSDTPSPDNRSSVTPKPRNTRIVTTTPLDTPTPPPRNLRSEQADPSRKGKRRLAQYSDEEGDVVGEDVSMGGSPDHDPPQRQYGGVYFFSVPKLLILIFW